MSQVHVSTHPLVQHKLTLLRKKDTDSKKFRELVKELAILIAYEATADLEVEPYTVETPLALASGFRLKGEIGLIPILRSGLGLVEGVWEMMPSAEVWHIGLFRDERTLRPVEYYNKLPVRPTVNVCLVLDPMLATGGSAIATVNILKRWGADRIKFMGLI
ncbi:MAG TPA: uracil phosphoribosyltransferase, partial [Anaerolineae bacterium]|nr:uracil phosphoribosyltransferase [Anaerolineae bacterium]